MWTNYETAANLLNKDTEIRTATLLACIGQEGFELYETMDFADATDRKKIDKVLDRLERYFIGEINETFERFKFNQRVQEPYETIDCYVSALRTLIKPCNFAALEDSLLRDRIVMGISDDASRRKLLQTRDLDIKRAIDICRACEVSSRQVREMRPSEDVKKIGQTRSPRNRQSFARDSASAQRTVSTNRGKSPSSICKFCGSKHEFKKELCPAFGKSCRKCLKKNHFATMCKSKPENLQYTDVYTGSRQEDILVLGKPSVDDYPKRLFAKLLVGNELVQFQLDSGASVNVLPEEQFRTALGRQAILKPALSR